MKPPADPKKLRVNFNIGALRAKDARLYQDVVRALGFAGKELVGEVSIPQAQWLAIPNDLRDRVTDYLYTVNPDPKAHMSEEPPKREEAQHDLKFCPCQGCSAERARQRQIEQQRLVEAQKPGMNRLKEYFEGKVSGYTRLLNNDFNGEVFSRYINDPAFDKNLIIEPKHIDEFVVARKDDLMWTLPDGSEQLPLDASEAEMRRASIPQLRDLSARRNEGKSWFNRVGCASGDISVDSSRRGGTSRVM